MGIEQVGLQFITCDVLKIWSLSLEGYLSAFDEKIWTTLILLIFLSASGLKISEMCENTTHLKHNISKIFAPVTFLFEQSTNVPKKISCRLIIITWLFIGVVLSNSYKGQNITDLSSPLPSIPIKYFEELNQLNFTIYSRPMRLRDVQQVKLAALEAGNYNERYKTIGKETEGHETVFELETQNHQSQLKYLIDLISNVRKLTNSDIWYNISKAKQPDVYLNFLRDCHKSAYVSFSNEIGESVAILKRILYNYNMEADRKKAVDSVAIGTEVLAKYLKTWNVYYIAHPGDSMIKRVHAGLESGIAKQWYDWQKRVKSYRDLVLLSHVKTGPKRLAMTDNFVVVFYVHFALLLISVLVYLTESIIVCVIYQFIKSIIGRLGDFNVLIGS